jgi:hypothetical protein
VHRRPAPGLDEQTAIPTRGINERHDESHQPAAGGIGHLAVQIAKARGADVTALASAADTDFVRSLGADEVIDHARTDFTQAVKEQDVGSGSGGRRPSRPGD